MSVFLKERIISEDGYSPPVDLYEAGDSLVFEIDLPGIDPGDVYIYVLDDILVVEGVRNDPDAEKKRRYICMERRLKGFRRTLKIPVPVDPAAGRAFYRDGVIRVELPKALETPVRIQIEKQ
jgi:HSP20 family protein